MVLLLSVLLLAFGSLTQNQSPLKDLALVVAPCRTPSDDAECNPNDEAALPLPTVEADPLPTEEADPLLTDEADRSDKSTTISRPDSQQFQWKKALKQSFRFLAFERGVDVPIESGTRAELRGPFLKDYFRSVGNMSGWRDGDPAFTNYFAHPLQGAISGYLQIQNDPRGVRQTFGWTKQYWKSRLKAMGWAAAYSAQFELGPGISEAMIGNVGLAHRYRRAVAPSKPPNGGMGFVDLVITPTVGTAWIVAEDLVDKYVIRKIAGTSLLGIAVRALLNPARSSANVFRFQTPWHRDTR